MNWCWVNVMLLTDYIHSSIKCTYKVLKSYMIGIMTGIKLKCYYALCIFCACLLFLSFCIRPSIGYPVVYLGFYATCYFTNIFKLRIQKAVQNENDFHMHLLQNSLPPGLQVYPKNGTDGSSCEYFCCCCLSSFSKISWYTLQRGLVSSVGFMGRGIFCLQHIRVKI